MTTRTRRRLIADYVNGNYVVKLYDDGTKIKSTRGEEFCAEFPDSIDLKITDYCDMNCPNCHESSSLDGRHANLSEPFLDTLRSGTELAIGGGNPLSHPYLKDLLVKMKDKGVICNLTVNELHFMQNVDALSEMMSERLIWGLGISLSGCDGRMLDFAARTPNVVLHGICGILDESTAQKLYGRQLKILLLGYKDFGRGKAYHSEKVDENVAWLKDNLKDFCKNFHTVCFDNLALEQLDVRSQVPDKVFDGGFMGEDGTSSMYVDLVNKQYAKNSTSTARYPLTETVKQTFDVVNKKAR